MAESEWGEDSGGYARQTSQRQASQGEAEAIEPEATLSEIQRRLAKEFEGRGWPYDLGLGRQLSEASARSGSVDPKALARLVPNEYLERNRINRQEVEEAIDRSIGSLVPVGERRSVDLIINDHRHVVHLEAGARIVDSSINVGSGIQVNVEASAPRDQVLSAIRLLVEAGLAGDWNGQAAQELAAVLESRDDVLVRDVQEVVEEVVRTAQPSTGRLQRLLDGVAASAVGGVLGTGMSAAIGSGLTNLLG